MPCVASRDVHIGGSDGTGTSGRSDTVGENLVTAGLELGVGEDEADVAADVREEALVLRVVGDEGLEGAADL